MSPETPLPQGLREGAGRAWDRQQGTEQTGMYESKAFGNTSKGHDPQPLTRSPHAAAGLPHTRGGRGARMPATSWRRLALRPSLYKDCHTYVQHNKTFPLLSPPAHPCCHPSPPHVFNFPFHCLPPCLRVPKVSIAYSSSSSSSP